MKKYHYFLPGSFDVTQDDEDPYLDRFLNTMWSCDELEEQQVNLSSPKLCEGHQPTPKKFQEVNMLMKKNKYI